MSTTLPTPPEGFHSAAERLAEAIREAVLASLDLEGSGLPDVAFDAVAGGQTGSDEVYRASADFVSDWRADAASPT